MRQQVNVESGFRYAGLAAIVILLALTSMMVPARQATETPGINIENFGKVNDNYYRGSQPMQAEFEQLKKLGVKTVIDLRKDSLSEAPEWVRRSGMKYFNIPLKASTAATEEQTTYFLSLVNDPSNWPVYVHCKGGRHRTGALTAVYRITHDKWTADQAFQEMKKYDFNNGLFGGPGAQKRYVYSFYERYHSGNGQR
jgi:protein tyrosine/serine phosphatase